MKKLNKLMAALLALVMCLSLLPMAAFAEDLIDEEMSTPSVYDEVIQAAGDAVGAAEEAVKNAQEAADKAANEKIDAATDTAMETVDKQTDVVDAANKVIDSAAAAAKEQAEIAAGAKETVESSSSSMAEKEAAVLLAQDAAEKAAKAAEEAQGAWKKADQAVKDAETAVKTAETEYQRILEEHSHGDPNDEEFKAKLDAAGEKLKAAQADLDGKTEANQKAKQDLETAKEAAKQAQTDYDAAKNASNASGFDENRIENVADQQANLNEGDKTLAEQTQEVKDNREALDNLGTTDDAEQAVENANKAKDEAQTALDSFDKTGLDNEEKSRQDYKDASDKLAELNGQTAGLESERNRLWSEYNSVLLEWTPLDYEVRTWGQKDTFVSDNFTNPALKKWSNANLKDAVDEWEKSDGSNFSYYAQYAFNNSNYRDAVDGKAKFMEAVYAALERANIPEGYEKYDALTSQKQDLYDEWDKARQAVETNGSEIVAKETEVNTLKNLVDRFDELNRLTTALETAKSGVTTAQGELDELQGKIEAAKKAYDDAVKALQKTLQVNGTDYNVSDKTGHDKLVKDAENLQKAIEALNDLKVKNQAKADADEAAVKAAKAFQEASDAMDAANKALNTAKDALKNAPSDCSLKKLAELKADLAAKQARFNEVKADFDAKATDKTQADKDAQQAAEDAKEALNRFIASLPTGDDTGDTDTTIDDTLIPLASGPVTRAQFVDYLWRHEGSPAAESELFADHEYAPAIAWALSVEIIGEDSQPDELVTVADVRAILGSFAQVFGTNAVDVADLTTLTGADDEAVLNCDQVLAEFFGEEYVVPEDLDSLETDTAA